MACVKVKMATGTVIFQYQQSKFSKNTINARCLLCKAEPEDVTHFILRCQGLTDIREDICLNSKVKYHVISTQKFQMNC